MVAERSENTPVRLAVIGVICVALFASLFVRLYYLQVIDHQTYQVQSKAVHLRIKHEEGPRGRILDRNGKVLVDNKISVVVGIDKQVARGDGLGNGDKNDSKAQLAKRKKVFQQLAGLLTRSGLPKKVTSIETLYTDPRYSPNDFVPIIDEGVTEELKAYLGEHHEDFPGIVAKARTVRVYPYGNLAAHLLGYVGQITESELSLPDVKSQGTTKNPAGPDAKPYAPDDQIGKTGVERAYEQYLRGKPGDTILQVDARGQSIGIAKEPDLAQGDDVWLSIDIDLQAATEKRLAEQIAARNPGAKNCKPACNAKEGSAVIINPSNGQVLAMASYPTFDPSQLVNGISTDLWEKLNSKENGKPMLNRALNESFAPGSTFKLVTTLAGLRTGVINPAEVYQDRGKYKLEGCKAGKCEFQNAGGEALGGVNLQEAITRSSDTYFFRVGDVLWRGRAQYGDTPIQDAAKDFGFGQKSGINLPNESAGVIGSPEWLAAVYDKNPKLWDHRSWTVGDNLNAALGQGLVAVTPLQLANAYATFANGGTRYVPQMAIRVTRPKSLAKPIVDLKNVRLVKTFDAEVAGKVDFPNSDQYAIVYNGFQGVTKGGGTAASSFADSPTAWPMAGKTGTAQVKDKADTSLFVGWGPATGFEPAQYAMVSVIPEGGFGNDGSAPVVFGVLKQASENTLPIIVPAVPQGPAAGTPVATTTTTTTPPIEIATSDPTGAGTSGAETTTTPTTGAPPATTPGSG